MQRFVNPTPFGSTSASSICSWRSSAVRPYRLGRACRRVGVITVSKQWLRDPPPARRLCSGISEVILFRCADGAGAAKARRAMADMVSGSSAVPVAHSVGGRSRCVGATGAPDAGSPAARGQAVTRRFGGLLANNNMSLEVAGGRDPRLIGPNGAGKARCSTRFLAWIRADLGRSPFPRRVGGRQGSRTIARMGMSRTFQHVACCPDERTRVNVAIGAMPRAACCRRRGGWTAPRRRACSPRPRQIERGPGRAHVRRASSLALGQRRILRDRACARLRPLPAAARRACRRFALQGERKRSATCCATARRRHGRAAGRARHGLRGWAWSIAWW